MDRNYGRGLFNSVCTVCTNSVFAVIRDNTDYNNSSNQTSNAVDTNLAKSSCCIASYAFINASICRLTCIDDTVRANDFRIASNAGFTANIGSCSYLSGSSTSSRKKCRSDCCKTYHSSVSKITKNSFFSSIHIKRLQSQTRFGLWTGSDTLNFGPCPHFIQHPPLQHMEF